MLFNLRWSLQRVSIEWSGLAFAMGNAGFSGVDQIAIIRAFWMEKDLFTITIFI